MNKPLPAVLWGAVPSGGGGGDPATLETAVGFGMSVSHLGGNWIKGTNPDGTYAYNPFPAALLTRERSRGRVVCFDWIRPQADPAFSNAAVLRGDHDAGIHAWAQGAAADGHPVLLRMDHEVNGDWYVWGEPSSNAASVASKAGNAPGSSVQAWRHIHDIFTAEGAVNVAWARCLNVMSADKSVGANGLPNHPTSLPPSTFDPGPGYVDWWLIDGYNWGTASGNTWQTFAQVLGGRTYGGYLQDTYAAVATAFPSVPLGIGETGCNTVGGTRAAWLLDMLTCIPLLFPRIRLCLFMDGNYPPGNWSVTSPADAASAAAMRQGLSVGPYVPSGVYLPSTTIAPPSYSALVLPDVPPALSARGSTWDAVALSLGTDLATLTQQFATANKQTTDAQAVAALAQSQAQLATVARDAARLDAATGRRRITDMQAWAASAPA